MSEYIEREKALDAVVAWAETCPATAISEIECMPAADVAPVVHCRDCKYKAQAKVNKKGFLICPASGMEITDDDFCSYGKRRESEESK